MHRAGRPNLDLFFMTPTKMRHPRGPETGMALAPRHGREGTGPAGGSTQRLCGLCVFWGSLGLDL